MRKDYKDLKVGEEFQLVEAKRAYLREWTRTAVTIAIVATCLAALAVSAYFELRSGEGVLLETWAIVAVPLSAITGYYYRGTKSRGENDDAGTV